MKKITNVISASILCILFSCGGGDDGGDNPDPVLPPQAVTLIFPENNTECNEGIVISDTESTVTFRWNASENTDSYTVAVKNLEANTTQNLNTNNLSLDITIDRGTPYSWSVISKSNGAAQTAESPVWKFYNAGLPVENHIPFPAEAVSPKMGSSVDAGTITLNWQGSDIDNDIVSYEVFIDTANPPSTLAGNSTSNSMAVEVSSGQIYYWRVVTNDNTENTSDSEVFQFRVN